MIHWMLSLSSRRLWLFRRVPFTMLHYMVLHWDDADQKGVMAAESIVRRLQSKHPAWSRASNTEKPHIYYLDGRQSAFSKLALPDDKGVIFGAIFRSIKNPEEEVTKIQAFSQAECDRIIATEGQSLVDEYWGRYVAILFDRQRDRFRIIRDPSEGFPCYYTKYNGVSVFFSHADDAIQVGGVRPVANWSFINATFKWHRLHTRETAIEQVFTLQGGECINCSPTGESRCFYWSPHEFCSSTEYEESEVAAEGLRSAVKICIRAWASTYNLIVEQLSGGLDSAVLLSALRRVRDASNIICVNQIFPGWEGDERTYARNVAALWNCELIEQELDPSDVRLSESVAMPAIPIPSYHMLSYRMDQALGRLSQERGAQAIMSGRGGDQLFYNSNTPLTVADYFWKRHGCWHPIRTVKDRAIAIESTIAAVLSDAWKFGVRQMAHDPYTGYFREAPFVNREALESINLDDFKHPWLKCDQWQPPGKLEHIFAVIDSQKFNYEPVGRSQKFDVVDPFVSQPIFEQCLATPSYVLAKGRRDRSLVREAFANEVPPDILKRRTKGGTTRYFNEVIEGNLEFLCGFLLEGELARQKLIIRDSLEPILRGYEPIPIDFYFSFMSCISVEAWFRSLNRVGTKEAA